MEAKGHRSPEIGRATAKRSRLRHGDHLITREVDLLAIGAGPSNLALAVALEEIAPDGLAQETLIIEGQEDVKWHRNMLLPWAQSQVSFLKDLVTLRNPRSHYSFVNYLHTQGRLDDFINMATFTPYRREISDYLQWVANSLQRVRVEYGKRCTSIEARRSDDGFILGWLVKLQDGETIATRDLVIGVGREPYIPGVLRNVRHDLIVHSTQYLDRVAKLSKELPYRVVVVGGAQSAAEMFRALHDDLPNSQPTIVMHSIGFVPYEISKFTNELYYPSFVDTFFNSLPECRGEIRREMHRTNYGGLAPGLLEELYRMLYLQRLSGTQRTRVITMTEIVAAHMDKGEVVLDLEDQKTGAIEQVRCDLVFLGTGYDKRMPRVVRELAGTLGLQRVEVTRQYRVAIDEPTDAAVYLQGVNEETHGIADSLLSVVAQRSADIVQDILERQSNGVGAQFSPFSVTKESA